MLVCSLNEPHDSKTSNHLPKADLNCYFYAETCIRFFDHIILINNWDSLSRTDAAEEKSFLI